MYKKKALTLAVTTLTSLNAPNLNAKTHQDRVDALEARVHELEAKLEKALDALDAATSKQAAATAAPAPDIKKIDQKVKLIERKLEVEKETADAKWAKLPKNVELGTQGLKVVSNDENFIMYLRALIQADGSFYMGDDQASDSTNSNGDGYVDRFYMRRVRPIIEGTVWKWFDYRIMPDFGMGTTRLFDAYLDFRYFREASLAGGKFKAPVSLERLQSATALPFIERAFPTQLAPNREIGFMLHGEFDKPGYETHFSPLERNKTHGGNFPMFQYPDFFSYQVGVFDGSRNNGNIDSDTNDSKVVEGRIFSHPFLNTGIQPLEGLGIGIAGTWGQQNDDQLSNYQSPGLNNIFVYNSAARGDGTQYRVYPQGYWIWGPFQLVGEYAFSSQVVANQTVKNFITNNNHELTQSDQAWNVTASYVLTGEENTFLNQGLRPRHPFDPLSGNWGAFQVAARWSYIDFDNDIFKNVGTDSKPIYPFADPRRSVSDATTWALGINWWLNPNFKLMADYSQTSFNDGAGIYNQSGALTPVIASRETEKVWQTRIQLGF
ncbi:porin [Methylococcus sp. ANG]|uniref:OprO/OprP family phosphate-selective porin n=1 Tax=Methylococcus sp. ANG TaxID=3231903 RepID=UPI00345A3D01